MRCSRRTSRKSVWRRKPCSNRTRPAALCGNVTLSPRFRDSPWIPSVPFLPVEGIFCGHGVVCGHARFAFREDVRARLLIATLPAIENRLWRAVRCDGAGLRALCLGYSRPTTNWSSCRWSNCSCRWCRRVRDAHSQPIVRSQPGPLTVFSYFFLISPFDKKFGSSSPPGNEDNSPTASRSGDGAREKESSNARTGCECFIDICH